MKLWIVLLVIAVLGGLLWLLPTAPASPPAPAREGEDLERQAEALNHLAVADQNQGTTSAGCENYRRAAQIYDQIEQHLWAASQERNYGGCLMILGEMEKAKKILEGVLTRYEDFDDREGKAAALRELGWWFHLEGKPKPALEKLNASIALDSVFGTYDRLGSVQLARGKYSEAEAAFRTALAGAEDAEDAEDATELDKAHILANLCDLHLETNQTARGRENCVEARRIFERSQAKDSLADLLHSLAQIERLDDRLDLAEEHLVNAVDLIEEMRRETDPERHRISFHEDRLKLFQALITVRMELDDRDPDAGWHLRALETHNQMRARGLLDKLDREPTPKLDFERLRAELDDNTWILVYHLDQAETDDSHHFLWRIARDGVERFRLSPIVKFRDLADRWYLALVDERGSTSDAERANGLLLADTLFSPLAGELTDQRLVIVADSALQKIPFAALPSSAVMGRDREPLMARHELVMLPSLSFLMELRHRGPVERAEQLLAIFADPVFSADDDRLESDAQKVAAASELAEMTLYPPLPQSGEEGREIQALAPESSQLFLGFDVERTALLSGILSRFTILHFATHGRVDKDREPALILSRYDPEGQPLDSALKLSDFQRQELQSLELAVLSACQTASGEEHRGEGILSLAHGLMQAGAPRVIVSLWPVGDRATKDLMVLFYRGLLEDRLTPSAALRQAQQTLWRQGRLIKDWGGFVLQGDWRGFAVDIGSL